MNKYTNLTNYHCHTLYCDGRADMDSFLRFASAEHFTSFGFSSHAPLPFPTNWTMEWDRMDDYLNEFGRMKEKYRHKMELIIGLEIDYIDDKNNPANEMFQKLPLDFRIGSVHMLYDKDDMLVDTDCPAETFALVVDNNFEGDLDYVVKKYYAKLQRMIELGGFDILGHADKIHYNASCYRYGIVDEPWYDKLMKEYFGFIAEKGYQVEINTKQYPDYAVFYPDCKYFSLLHHLGIRIQVNSDAHYPERINNGRFEALSALYKAGYREVMEWHHGQWQATRIE